MKKGVVLVFRQAIAVILKPTDKVFFLGARTDLWFNKIDWKQDPNLITEVKGRTDITVFQPTVEAGYVVNLKKEGWSFVPSIAFGAEINIKTKGEPVGEGAVLLLGFTFRKRF